MTQPPPQLPPQGEPQTATQPEDDTDWELIARSDPMVRLMLKHNVPLTRENYIDMVYGAPGTEDFPKQWTPEHEADLPGPFQR